MGESKQPSKQAERFAQLQACWQTAANAEQDHRISLAVKYGSGNSCYASTTERKRLEQLSKAERKASERFYTFLASISPRDWTCMVPCSYCRDRLTFSDAITAEALAEVPPPAWSYDARQLQHFAAALESVSK
jgi:hypothetical protein